MDWGVVEAAEGFELLRGAPFFSVARSVAGLRRESQMGCVVPSVEDMRENGLEKESDELLGSYQTEHGTPPGVRDAIC